MVRCGYATGIFGLPALREIANATPITRSHHHSGLFGSMAKAAYKCSVTIMTTHRSHLRSIAHTEVGHIEAG